jgi:hypothetical protein
MTETILLICTATLSAFAQNQRAITVTTPARVESTPAALIQHIWALPGLLSGYDSFSHRVDDQLRNTVDIEFLHKIPAMSIDCMRA